MLLSIQLLFLLLLTSALAEKQGKKLVETIPAAFSVFVLLLYILAFFNRMWLVDFIAPIGIFALCYFRYREKSFREIAGQVADPSFLVFAAVAAVGMLAVSARGLTAFDDWNFWGPDIKSIFCLQGYAAKGFNCAPDYGDYPRLCSWLQPGSCTVWENTGRDIWRADIFLSCRSIWRLFLPKFPAESASAWRPSYGCL